LLVIALLIEWAEPDAGIDASLIPGGPAAYYVIPQA